MCAPTHLDPPQYAIKTPRNLSPRIQWLRDYYFQGTQRAWNNEFTAWTTGVPWDFQFNELSFYIVPETYTFLQTFRSSFRQAARPVALAQDFWKWRLPERRAWFVKEVMVRYLPKEILPGDLIAGGRFNILASCCMNEREAKERDALVYGPKGCRASMLWLHNHGYGNAGATSGHLVPGYGQVIERGWKGIYTDIEKQYQALSEAEKQGPKGAQLRAMLISATLPRELAGEYSRVCAALAENEPDAQRQAELAEMAHMLQRIPWEPARTFWEAVQALWITHMLVMSDEGYPGPGDSFGRIDQYLYPAWEYSLAQGMEREAGKEILKCFWMHCNTAYDAMIRTGGNQGITAGYGQLLTLSGTGPGGTDLTNDLTYAMLEVIDEMSPILEPKPNVRLHRGSPEKLLDKVVDMIESSQGAPFLLNFDERSMAGLLLQAEKAGVQQLIHPGNVHDYAPVGCLENTMVGNDRSGTVDTNLNLVKAVELALTGGYDLLPFTDPLTGKTEKPRRDGPDTGDCATFATWEQFWNAYAGQTRYIIGKIVETYETSEQVRARFHPTPYLSCLVKGCAEKGLDITQGGAELSFTTVEAVTYATTVDSLLAIRYLVFEKKLCTLPELVQALRDNWVGHEILQAQALNKAPKYGRDDDAADALGLEVMKLWTEETWKHRTRSTNRQFRPGMLSWNYWIAYSDILPATADGRPRGKFLSNALCPSNGADTNGPTANVNSVGKVLGGRAGDGQERYQGYMNLLPNGGSHTMTFNPSLLRDRGSQQRIDSEGKGQAAANRSSQQRIDSEGESQAATNLEHKEKFKAFLKGYIENGGTALQINMIDAEMLRDAQRHPEDYRHLLVRVTGYNAYFTSIGKELQDEIIARESHEM